MRRDTKTIKIVVAIIGTIIVPIIVAFLNLRGDIIKTEFPVGATQTAEFKATQIAEAATQTATALFTLMPTNTSIPPISSTGQIGATPPNQLTTPSFFSIRVEDSDNKPIPSADVIVIFKGSEYRDLTDITGLAGFTLPSEEINEIAILVQADPNQYKRFFNRVPPPYPQPYFIILERAETNAGSMIVRVVDSNDGISIARAKVLLLIRGDVYSSSTDSNGIVSFELPFSIDGLQAQITVEKDGKTDEQIVTLLPGHIHRVFLDSVSGTIDVTSEPVVIPFPSRLPPTAEVPTPNITHEPATTTSIQTGLPTPTPPSSNHTTPPPSAIPDTPPPSAIPDTPPPSAIPNTLPPTPIP